VEPVWPDVCCRDPKEAGALGLFGEAMAGPLEDGEAAYQRGDYETAVRLWHLSGGEGNVYAQFNLGLLYSSGQGLPQDHAQAHIWFRKAADQGDARAQVYLGGMYRVGRGVRQDDAQAVALFRKAANQGTSSPRPTLARCTVTAKECRKTLFALICGSTW
jgi:TPR repeat protein